ncbi:MAG TPA: GNAT family N-acetyltransferase, partial [Caulobacteraceae bacterium]|nr:GNAT family N-acetyltransferase [Caulobacteraceae bacterium]
MTERLVLLPHEAKRDLEGLFPILSDPAVMEHIGNGAITHEEARDYLVLNETHWEVRGLGGWTIRRRAIADVIGYIFLRPTPEASAVEVGYTLGKHAWGNGYATEALSEVLRFACERRFETVVAVVRPANNRSAKVLLRCGFQFDGQRENDGKAR